MSGPFDQAPQDPNAPARPDPAPPSIAPEPAAAPVSGWVTSTTPAVEAAPPGSFVIAGVGARTVAYLLDAALISIIPTLLTFAVIDLRGLFRAAIEASQTGANPQMTLPVTLPFILVSLVALGIQFIYFVGFWTSGGRATPGMRVMRMQVIDAASGQELGLMPAITRWVLLGAPLGLLAVVEPLQAFASSLSLLVLFVVLLTIIANDRRQGFHDRAAGSLVIRDAHSGNAATVVGCLLVVAILVVVAIVAGIIAISIIGPELPYLIPDSTII